MFIIQSLQQSFASHFVNNCEGKIRPDGKPFPESRQAGNQFSRPAVLVKIF
jgi:hypothetical protein